MVVASFGCLAVREGVRPQPLLQCCSGRESMPRAGPGHPATLTADPSPGQPLTRTCGLTGTASRKAGQPTRQLPARPEPRPTAPQPPPPATQRRRGRTCWRRRHSQLMLSPGAPPASSGPHSAPRRGPPAGGRPVDVGPSAYGPVPNPLTREISPQARGVDASGYAERESSATPRITYGGAVELAAGESVDRG